MAVLYMLLRAIDRLVGVAVSRETSLTALSGLLHAIAALQAGDKKREPLRHQRLCVGLKPQLMRRTMFHPKVGVLVRGDRAIGKRQVS